MLPVVSVGDVENHIKELYSDAGVITIGLLIADARQDEARQYVLNYMNLFDRHSGKYIDFFIPGYYTDDIHENGEKRTKYHPNSNYVPEPNDSEYVFSLSRTGARYYFNNKLFENFIENITEGMGITYTYNPMLILIEVDMQKCRGEIFYQKKMIIELDEDSSRGLRRTGLLFDKIFEIAKHETRIERFGENVRLYYMKGKHIDRIVSALEGNYISAIKDICGDVKRFRIN